LPSAIEAAASAMTDIAFTGLNWDCAATVYQAVDWETLDRALDELLDEGSDAGEVWGETLAGLAVSPVLAAAAAGTVAAGVIERRRRRRRPAHSEENEDWLWLFSDLLGVAPGVER
jgi:hypothetical protein